MMKEKNKYIFENSKKLCLILILNSCLFLCAQKQPKNNVITKDYFKINKTAIFYFYENRLVDSIVFNNINFKISNLNKIDETTWQYDYSTRCGSDCKTRNQVILICKNKRLYMAYFGYSLISYYYSSKYDSNKSSTNVDKEFYCQYLLNEEFYKGKPIITEKAYKREGTNIPDTIIKRYNLLFDKHKTIFYTNQIKLNGVFKIDSKEIKLANKELPILKFTEVEWVFYNEHWYEFNRVNKSFIQP